MSWFPGGELGTSPENKIFETLHPDSPILAVRAAIGDYRTIAFWAWAWGMEHGKEYGRTRRRHVYVPKAKSLKSHHGLIQAIGRDGAIIVCDLFAGASIDIPIGKSVMRRQAKKYAVLLKNEGFSIVDIAGLISEDYPVSAYQVREWLRTGDN